MALPEKSPKNWTDPEVATAYQDINEGREKIQAALGELTDEFNVLYRDTTRLLKPAQLLLTAARGHRGATLGLGFAAGFLFGRRSS